MKKILSSITAFALSLSLFGGFTQAASAESTSEVETNNTKETATPLTFSETGDYDLALLAESQGSFENNQDVDFYKFTLAKDGEIKVSLSQLAKAELSIELYNDQDEMVQSWVLAEGNEYIHVFNEGLRAGTYYLKVEVYSGSAITENFTNLYGISVRSWANNYVEKEFNDEPTIATPMTLNKYYKGYTDFETDDIFKIQTTANGKLTVRGTYSPNVEMEYVLIDSNYEPIEDWTLEVDPEADGDVYNLFTVGVKKGTYYLVVTHDVENDEVFNEKYSTQVNFTADGYTEFENNETTGTATSILLKRTYNGMMSMNADVDYYKVNLAANANITLNMSQAPSTILKVTIANSKNGTIKTLFTKKGKSSMVSLGNVNLPKGTYYVRVQYSSGSAEQVPYKLQLQPKIYWGKVEYKPGMKGKTVAVTTSTIYKLKSGKLYYYKNVAKGTETPVYYIDSKYGYKIAEGLYMKKNSTVKYYTVPSSIISAYNAVNK